MHPAAADFIRRAQAELVGLGYDGNHACHVNKFDVVEVGSRNINGQAKDVWGGHIEWIGTDIVKGPGVDIVGHGAEVLRSMLHDEERHFDLAIACEVFEHTKEWVVILAAMASIADVVLVTCAGQGRAPHSATGSSTVPPEEHYQNIWTPAFGQAVHFLNLRPLLMEHNVAEGDLYFLGLTGDFMVR